MASLPPYDPTLYKGSAPYYLRGRPSYSRALRATLAAECRLDGTGRLLDVGCGPGVLAVELAPVVREVVGLDPDPDMLAEAARHAQESGVVNVRWVQGLAEQVQDLDLGGFRLVTFGQSFHWTDRERVAEAVYDLLEPGDSMAMVAHTANDRPVPSGPGYPPIPHEEIESLIVNTSVSAGGPDRGTRDPPQTVGRALGRTRFGTSRQLYAEGRPDIVQDADGVLANFLSMSYAAPHLLGARLDSFEADIRQLLAERSPSGLFWDWPGDTGIVIATKPR